MRRRAGILALCALFLGAGRVLGAEGASAGSGPLEPSTEETRQALSVERLLTVPASQGDEDRPSFLAGLRRFEIVAFGAFPILLFYTNFGFDLYRYVRSGYDPYFAPWPFRSGYSYRASTSEVLVSIGTAALLSVGVAALDAVIRSSRARRSGGRGDVRSGPPSGTAVPAGGARVDSP